MAKRKPNMRGPVPKTERSRARSTSRSMPHKKVARSLRRTQAPASGVPRETVAALEEENKRLKAILESISDGLVTFDPDWRYIYVNEKAAQMIGFRQAESLGKRVHDLFPQHIQTASFKEFQRIMAEGKPAQMEYYSPGAKRWLRTNLYPGSVGMTSILTDITDSKRLDEMRDEFIGIAAHEMKTPVASAKAYAQVLEALFTGKGDAGSLELAVKMSEQLDKLARLITNLLDVSKIEGGIMQLRYTAFDFNRLVTEVVDEVRPTTKHAIVTDLCQPVLVEADRDRVRQVIMNFLTNAIKYSPHTTKIIVSTEVKEGAVACRVQDFGIGIDKKDQVKIFDRFYRAQGAAQETYPGIGLGLHISSAIIAQHGGTCRVESVKGEGSSFSFTLPVDRAHARHRNAAVRKWARPPLKHKKSV